MPLFWFLIEINGFCRICRLMKEIEKQRRILLLLLLALVHSISFLEIPGIFSLGAKRCSAPIFWNFSRLIWIPIERYEKERESASTKGFQFFSIKNIRLYLNKHYRHFFHHSFICPLWTIELKQVISTSKMTNYAFRSIFLLLIIQWSLGLILHNIQIRLKILILTTHLNNILMTWLKF